MVWICLAACLVFFVYLLLIVFFTTGWFRKKVYSFVPVSQEQLISVIVAFRNEENHLSALLDALKKQTYQNTEFIFVDDHSTDNSTQIINGSGIRNVSILHLGENKTGKKEAISIGIDAAKGSLIITTDADCIPSKNWNETIVSFHQNEKADFIIAPVKHFTNNSFIKDLFAIDFLALQAAGAGAAEIQFPFICNGANLAFTKSLWLKLKGDNNAFFASGDDVFLLHSAINILKPEKIRYLFSYDAIVSTPAPENIPSFVQQRMRWGGKAKGYKNQMALLTSVTVFAHLTIMVLLLAGSFFSMHLFYCLSAMLFVKTMFELPLIFSALKFFKEERLIVFYFLLQPIYFLYTFIIAFLSLLLPYQWKNRTIRN